MTAPLWRGFFTCARVGNLARAHLAALAAERERVTIENVVTLQAIRELEKLT
jgi:hypothetical protein